MTRADKLAAIAARVRAGTYQIDTAAIADAMLETWARKFAANEELVAPARANDSAEIVKVQEAQMHQFRC